MYDPKDPLDLLDFFIFEEVTKDEEADDDGFVDDFDDDEDADDDQFEEAIGNLWECIGSFNPKVYGYECATKLAPKMQLSPQGWRGYIEMRPMREAVQPESSMRL